MEGEGLPYFYYDWSIIILLPGLLICLLAQARVKSTFAKYQKVAAQQGAQAQQVARRLLDEAGLQAVPIEVIGGQLSDHYDPRARVLRLSADVARSTSVASIGVAAHEVGPCHSARPKLYAVDVAQRNLSGRQPLFTFGDSAVDFWIYP